MICFLQKKERITSSLIVVSAALLTILPLIVPSRALAAISYGSSVSTLSASFNSPSVSGSDTLGVVAIQSGGGSSFDVSGITWGGVPMTLVDDYKQTSQRWFSMWEITSPASGVQAISVSGSYDQVAGTAAYYQGVSQSSPIDHHATADQTSSLGSITASVSVSDTNDWLVFGVGQGIGYSATAAIPGTVRENGSGTGYNTAYVDSDGPIGGAGSQTIQISWASFQTTWGVVAALTPSSGGGGGEGEGTTTPETNSHDEELYMYGVLLFFISFPVWDRMFKQPT